VAAWPTLASPAISPRRARAAARLHELGRELRFERDPEGALRVELRDVNGAVLRTVAPAEVFDFASGRLTA